MGVQSVYKFAIGPHETLDRFPIQILDIYCSLKPARLYKTIASVLK